MKRLIRISVFVATVAMALNSCQKSEIESPQEERQYEYDFILGSEDDDPDDDSRAVIGTECVEWEEDDQMGVYTKTAAGDVSYNTRGYVTPGTPATLKVYSFNPLEAGDKVYTYYPYKSQESQDPSSVILSIPVKQKESDAMPMVSLPMTVSRAIESQTNTAVQAGELKLLNLGSIVEFSIYSTTPEYASEKVQSVRFDTDGAIAGQFEFDLTRVDRSDPATLAISGYEETSVTFTPTEPLQVGGSKDDAAVVSLVVAPGTYAGSVVVTTDVAVYTFPISSPKEFVRSVVKPFGLNLRADVRKVFSEVTFDFNDPVKYGITPSAEQGGIDATPLTVADVTFTPVPGDNQVLFYTKVDAQNVVTYDLKAYAKTALTFSVPDGNVITAIAVSGSGRGGLVPDSGVYDSGKWYGSATSVTFSVPSVVDLTKVTVSYETGAPKTPQVISFAETQYEAVLGEEFLMPELTGANTDLTYSSSDEEVAAVDENGMITLLAEGTTVIKAVAQEDATYAPAQASYTLVVSDNISVETVQSLPWTEDFNGNDPLSKYEITQGENDTQTKIFSGSLAGGEMPELLLNGGGGILTATIDASEDGQNYTGSLTLTFKSNQPTYLSIVSSTEGVEIGKVTDTEYLLTLKNIGVFDLSLKNDNSSNARVDDISLAKGERLNQTLSFSATTYSYPLNELPADFDEPVLTGANTTVTYSSSNPAVADVNPETGSVTLGSVKGIATITAAAAESPIYRGASATYTITLVEQADELLTSVIDYYNVNNIKTLGSNKYGDYSSEQEILVNGITYGALNICTNAKSSNPSVYGKQFIQFKAESGYIYNKTGYVKSIRILVHPEKDASKILYVGSEVNPSISMMTPDRVTDETVILKDYDNVDSQVALKVYEFDLDESTPYFKIAPDATFWTYRVEVTYSVTPPSSGGSEGGDSAGGDEGASVAPALTGKGWLELPGNPGNQEYVYATYMDPDEISADTTPRNYTYNYDKDMFTSLWVAYPLYASATSGSCEASWKYNPDVPEEEQINVIPKSYGVNVGSLDNTDYTSDLDYYAKGHQIPDADRKSSESKNSQTGYMTNLTPQIHNGFNNSVWKSLEGALRTEANESDTVYVVTGAAFQKVGETKQVTWIRPQTETVRTCPVPNYYWKVALKVKRDSDGRVTNASTIGFWYEHKSYSGTGAKFNDDEYVVSVDQIEEWTGFDFFVNLADSIESSVEVTRNTWDSFSSF